MNLKEQLMQPLKAKAEKSGKAPYAGKEKSTRKPGKKLPVPPPKSKASVVASKPMTKNKTAEAMRDNPPPPVRPLINQAMNPKPNGKPSADAKTQPERRAIVKAMLADPKKDGIPVGLQVQNRAPLAPEVKRNVDALIASAKSATTASKDAEYRAMQKQTRTENKKAKAAAKKQRKEREAAGKTVAVPLQGKAALRAIADKAAKTHPITKVPPKGEQTRLNAAKASAPKVKRTANGCKPGSKVAMALDGVCAKSGATCAELAKKMGWTVLNRSTLKRYAAQNGVKLSEKADKDGTARYFGTR